MHIILTGATGTVGNAVLHCCLASPKVTRLSILTRRQFALPAGNGLDTQKAISYQTENITTSLMLMWPSRQYIRITHDYPLAAAKAFSSLSGSGKFNFVYVSGEGADPTEKTFTLFGKIKGRVEVALLALPSSSPYTGLRVFNVRPGYRLVDTIVAPLLRNLMPSQVSPTDVLAKVLVDLATGDGSPLPPGSGIEAEGRTVQSIGIRRFAEE
ncbi:hypothetical protein B0H10DRAFT_2166342 [Mycena sp. CBHHK59/15]|nr:hypothetical protein B0H10DRAFT_2166342 [Mycena sp. CBHHK59/15]